MSKAINIMIAGGGTGGHLFPALALADEIKRQRPEARLYYIGSKFGLEKEILPRKEIPFTLLPIRGLQRNMDLQGFGRNLLLPGRLLNSLVKVKRIFSSFNPDVVVGTGGYASALPLHVGIRREIPTLIQEQNSYPGITTRWFGSKVNRICIAFEEATRYFQKKKLLFDGKSGA
jgi:UDP-N-acetylglucosamine--N-acetylmuramyl-(pentapeptide) pyrophosphoryl-undecaprenol N-acetylglucosamine transferase